MAYDGFVIAGYEGISDRGGFWNALGAPPSIRGVRPDAWGFAGNRFAVAEAKTAGDINNTHTREQLKIFAALTGVSPGCRVYLSIRRSNAPTLDRVFADLGLVGSSNVVRVHVPDILLGDRQ